MLELVDDNPDLYFSLADFLTDQVSVSLSVHSLYNVSNDARVISSIQISLLQSE